MSNFPGMASPEMRSNRVWRTTSALVFLAFAVTVSCGGPSEKHKAILPAYDFDFPATRVVDQVDEYHGERIADPYRWLEDSDSPEVAGWVEAQNKLTRSYLDSLPQQAAVRRRVTQLFDHETFGVPQHRGHYYFFTHQPGLEEQSIFYSAEQLNGPTKVVLDPNTLSPDGTVSVPFRSLSDDGRFLAYGVSKAGSDTIQIRVREVASGLDLEDRIGPVSVFTQPAWSRDGNGFYYYGSPLPGASSVDRTSPGARLLFHPLGGDPSDDRVVYERPDHPDWWLGAWPTRDGRYLLIIAFAQFRYAYFVKDLQEDGPIKPLIPIPDAENQFIGSDGNEFWFRTDKDAPNRRLIAINVNAPEHWRDILPETDAALSEVRMVGNRFVAVYLRDAHNEVRLFRLDGSAAGEIPLPGLGSVNGFNGERGDTETFFTFSGFSTPASVYRYDFTTGRTEVWRRPQVDFDPTDFETRQVFYESRDGTRVPMFLSYRKGLEMTGDLPVLLYGYGGFSASLTPSFTEGTLMWMELGGVWAQPNIRGGGEYGAGWHEDGIRLNKQNSFDDFIAAAEWLIEHGYTKPRRIAAFGASNGGLLVGAVLNQRPDLFGAALPAYGLMDMLRFGELSPPSAEKQNKERSSCSSFRIPGFQIF